MLLGYIGNKNVNIHYRSQLQVGLNSSESHLYSRDLQFEFRCHTHNHDNELCGFSLVPPGKCWESTLSLVTAAFVMSLNFNLHFTLY